MNQFLDEILNPIPTRKKRGQTLINSNNNEITKNISNSFQKDQQIKFDEEKGQQAQQNEKYKDYEKQKVTEQIAFDHCEGNQFSKSSKMQNSYSQGVLREVRKVKIVNGLNKGCEQQGSNEFFPEDTEIQTDLQQYKLSKPLVLSTEQFLQIQKNLIKQELEQRYLNRIQKLEEQLQLKKKSQQQGANLNDKQKQNLLREIQRLNEDMEILKFQLNQKNTLIAELQMENQILNQHIFDVEQKISGIQLEVQNKVREKIKQFEQEHLINSSNLPQTLNPILQTSSQLQQSSRAIGPQPTPINSQRIDDLININELLKQKLQDAQFEKEQLQNQLKEHEKILSFREQQIKKNQQDINFEWKDIEKQKQSLLQREQQLITAEENVSKKITQIRFKQAQFQKWQTQLHTRQVNLDLKDQQFNKKLEELVVRQNIYKFEKERSIKEKEVSIGVLNNTISRKSIQDLNIQSVPQRLNDTITNQFEIARKYYQEPQFKYERSFDYQYQLKGRQDEIKNNIQRSYEEDKSYIKQNRERERSIYNGNNYRSQLRQGHLFVLPQNNSRIRNQSRSQSRSKQKILIRSNIIPSPVLSVLKNGPFKSNIRFSDQTIQTKQLSNLDGLGSKLQKLRDEIKREIDSIK